MELKNTKRLKMEEGGKSRSFPSRKKKEKKKEIKSFYLSCIVFNTKHYSGHFPDRIEFYKCLLWAMILNILF